MKKDEYYMDLAIVLAKKGGGNVNPNPQVGALIVKEGRIMVKVIMKNMGKLTRKSMLLRIVTNLPKEPRFM